MVSQLNRFDGNLVIYDYYSFFEAALNVKIVVLYDDYLLNRQGLTYFSVLLLLA